MNEPTHTHSGRCHCGAISMELAFRLPANEMQVSTAEENWSNGRCKTGPLGALQNTALRVVPVVHRRDPRGLRSVRFTR